MHTWRAVITGSCALQMLTGGDLKSNNLNIIFPAGSLEVLEEFIVVSLKYRRVDAVTRPNYAFRAVVQSFAKYRRGRLRITLSEAVSDNIFDMITSSPTTGDMIFMTPGGIAVFYPEWTLNRMVMLNHTMACRIPGHNVGCIENDNYKVYPTTAFLQDPCGELCPALWRKIADGGEWSLVLEWDLRYPIRPSMARSHTMW
jgi:hypothetical protein